MKREDKYKVQLQSTNFKACTLFFVLCP